MPLDQNPHQTVIRFGCAGFSLYACGFSMSQMRQFCLFTYPPRSKWASSEKCFFFAKIGIFCKSIAGPFSEGKTHWMVNWLQLLNQLNFVLHHTKVFMQNSSHWCLRNVQLLRTLVNWCLWRFTHTFGHSSNIFGCTHYFLLFTLWFIDEDASFFHNDEELTVLPFFQNPYAIFAQILQHYLDFQSNVAIFLIVFQSYTQPYSFGGRVNLIICQISHELSVTIHKISGS